MAQINLLPWREELRQEKKKEFLVQLLGFCMLVALCCFVWVQAMDTSIESQQYRNSVLDKEISLLKKQVAEIKELKKQRKELEARMKVIQDLEGKRSIIVRYFDELTRSIPDGVYLISLKRAGSVISIEGVSESNQRIASLMRNLNQSDWFSNPNLRSVVAEPVAGEQAQKFNMSVMAVLPTSEGDDNG